MYIYYITAAGNSISSCHRATGTVRKRQTVRPVYHVQNHTCRVALLHTDKKLNQIFLKYKEIQSGAVAKSYMRKAFLIYSMRKCANISSYMRRPLVIYDFALHSEWKIWFLFYQCSQPGGPPCWACPLAFGLIACSADKILLTEEMKKIAGIERQYPYTLTGSMPATIRDPC